MLSLTASLALLASVTWACGGPGGATTASDGAPPVDVVAGGFLRDFRPELGDCLDFTPDDVMVEKRCTEPHYAEVAAVVPWPEASGDGFPGESALIALGVGTCAGDIAEYVGTDFEDTGLGWEVVWPKRDAWQAGVHVLWCLAYDRAGSPLAAPVRDSGGLR